MENLLSLCSEPIHITIEQEQSHLAEQSELVEVTLLIYESIPHIPTVSHNNLDGESFAERIDKTYNEIAKWRKNLFLCQLAIKERSLINV